MRKNWYTIPIIGKEGVTMDLLHTTFKEMEQEFNEAILDLEIQDPPEQKWIRHQMFEHLNKTFPNLKLENIYTTYTKFSTKIKYEHDFQGIQKYDVGTIELVFSIRTKRVETSEKPYPYTKHDVPIKISHYEIDSCIASFDWKTEDPNDLQIVRRGCSSDGKRERKIGTCKYINDIIAELPSMYRYKYRQSILQPVAKEILIQGEKFEAIYSKLPSDVRDVLDKKVENRKVTNEIIDFIIDNKLVVI